MILDELKFARVGARKKKRAAMKGSVNIRIMSGKVEKEKRRRNLKTWNR